MTNDFKTTILGLISAIAGAIIFFFPGAEGAVKTIAQVVGVIAVALWGFFTNRGDTP